CRKKYFLYFFRRGESGTGPDSPPADATTSSSRGGASMHRNSPPPEAARHLQRSARHRHESRASATMDREHARRHAGNRAREMRSRIAAEAARIMSEQGVRDFGVAKRKAAERL